MTPVPGTALTFGRLLVIATRAFGINLLLLVGLGWLPPVALLVPFGTGYATGWNARVTPAQGALIGFIMGLWMLFVCAIVTGGFVVASLIFPGGLTAGAELGIALAWTSLVLHVGLFAGAGAMLGGHSARKEQAAAVSG